MMAGRKNKYFTHVQPHLAEIPEMLQTMTEQQIAKRLGVGYSNYMAYKNKYKELREAVKKGDQDLVSELKSVLKMKAKGFQYEESKKIIEHGIVIKEEIYTKQALPDVASINLLLKNLDKDEWSNDPQMLELRRREIELKEKQAW